MPLPILCNRVLLSEIIWKNDSFMLIDRAFFLAWPHILYSLNQYLVQTIAFLLADGFQIDQSC